MLILASGRSKFKIQEYQRKLCVIQEVYSINAMGG
jgi:hypothetical protein